MITSAKRWGMKRWTADEKEKGLLEGKCTPAGYSRSRGSSIPRLNSAILAMKSEEMDREAKREGRTGLGQCTRAGIARAELFQANRHGRTIP